MKSNFSSSSIKDTLPAPFLPLSPLSTQDIISRMTWVIDLLVETHFCCKIREWLCFPYPLQLCRLRLRHPISYKTRTHQRFEVPLDHSNIHALPINFRTVIPSECGIAMVIVALFIVSLKIEPLFRMFLLCWFFGGGKKLSCFSFWKNIPARFALFYYSVTILAFSIPLFILFSFSAVRHIHYILPHIPVCRNHRSYMQKSEIL